VAPTGLVFGTITSSSIQLSWTDNSTNETGFEIHRSLTSGGTYTKVGETLAGISNFLDNNSLAAGTQYFYRIYAVNAGGSSTPLSGNATTLPNAPTAPTGLVFGTITSSSIQMSWTDNSTNETGFEIHRSLASGGTYTKVGETLAGISTFTDNNSLAAGTQYFYRIYAVNAGGSSTPLSGNATTLPNPPAAPTNLTFSTVTSSSIQMSWTDNSTNETGFEIHRSLTSGGTFEKVGETLAGISTFTDINLADDTEYFYRVYAVNTGGISVPASGSVKTLLAIPAAPSGLSGTATGVCTVSLSWTDNSDNETGFRISRSLNSTFGYTQIAELGAGVTTYTDTETENVRTYYYRVVAFNGAGASAPAQATVVVNIVLNGGTIGPDQTICPGGDPEPINSLTAPSGGSGTWTYQWQSRVPPAPFADISGATGLTYNPPVGLLETTEYRRVSTAACGVVFSNVRTITVEDTQAPIFTTCPTDILVPINRDQSTASVPTPNPILMDNCGVVLLTWTLSGATTGASPDGGMNNLGTHVFNLGVTTVTYTAEDLAGNAATCSFDVTVELLPPAITLVAIPNVSMKIGDRVTATLTVRHDGNKPYTFVSGSIGGYPLIASSFTRGSATSYFIIFEINEGGHSYLAGQSIPVTNVVISDGTIQSTPYTASISQTNDPLDAVRPVISSMQVQGGTRKIGDQVILDITSDGTGYTADPRTTINGIPVTAGNVTLVSSGGNNYQLRYTVQQGDTDVGPGELKATVILIDPAGNVSLASTTVGNTGALTIDAHPPVVNRMEVPDMEVGVGGAVQVTVTADQTGYVAVSGTVVNGIPLSSSNVAFTEQGGGLYLLSYTVGIGDNDVPSGQLKVSLVLADLAGNTNTAYTILPANKLEVYTTLPTAVLAGTPAICEGEQAEMQVFLTGRSPWSFTISNGTTTSEYTDITVSTFRFELSPVATSTYTIPLVTDRNGVLNVGSGNVKVTVNEKTDVEIINLATGYSVEADPFPLQANVMGGVFSGPGVISATGYFDPGLADTVNSPHTIFYTYTNTAGCTSVASALVFVLGAEGDIFIPSGIVCDYSDPFEVQASNIAGVTGSFRLLDDGSPCKRSDR
jgi:hypothetical protein